MKANHYTMLARNAIKASLTHIDDSAHIGIGCSGGADSTAVLLGLSTLYKGKKAQKVHVVIIDHQLQEITSKISKETAKLAESLGFNTHVIPVNIGSNIGGSESAARSARYDAFESVIKEYDLRAFLIGHTKNDQAEQVFLGIIRGSGTRSLAGIPETRGVYIRPLLNSLSRSETQKVCEENNVDYWCDPHNDSLIYKRVSVRKLISDTEKAADQNIVDSLVRTSQISSEDAEALDFYTNIVLTKLEESNWNVEILKSTPKAIRKRVYRAKLLTLGARSDSLTFKIANNIDTMIESWRGQGAVSVTNGITVSRVKGILLFNIS